MEAPDVKRLKEPEEDAKLKKMFADASLENNAIKELVAKKRVGDSREARMRQHPS